MNNGQYPYGGPSAWGQSGSVQPGNVQPGMGQAPVQAGYASQPGYPQQAGYGAQPPYAPQPYGAQADPGAQPYAQPQPMGQQTAAQPGYAAQQPMANPYAAPQQTYQPQQHAQQPVYPQQTWQPYQQPVYGQQQSGYQQMWQQPMAPQQDRQGQPVNPYQGFGQGYTGVRTQPAQGGFRVPFDVVAKAVIFGVAPVLFLLAMVLGSVALKWVFLVVAIVGIAMMWMRDVVTPNTRLMMTLLCCAGIVVALVGALNGPAADTKTPQQNNQVASGNMGQGQAPVKAATDAPTAEETATPDPYGVDDPAQEILESFFYYWSINNDEGMLNLCAPSWKASVEDPRSALFELRSTRIPLADYVVTVAGSPDDSMRKATVKATIDKQNNRAKMDRYSFNIMMLKEDGFWYVQPESIKSYEPEVATEEPEQENTTPTQPPLYTGTPTTILYWNDDGGSYYHLDPKCDEVHPKYLPMAEFYFSQLGEKPYNELNACNACGAPLPED